MKKRFCLLGMALLVVSLVLVGCGNNQAATVASTDPSATTLRGEGENYAVIMALGQLEFFDALKAGVNSAADQLGATWYPSGPQEFIPDQIVQAIDQAVANKVNGIVLHGQTAETADAVNNAIAKGIPVIVVNTDIPSNRISFIGCNPYQAGYDMGDQMGRMLNGKTGTVVISSAFSIAQPSALDNARGAEDALKNYPGIKVVRVDDTSDASVAATNVSAALQSYQDIVGVIGQQAYSAVGICTAIREAGKTGQIIVIGRDRDAATLELIEKDELAASYAQNSFVEGYIALMWLHDYINGNLRVINDYLGAGTNPLPKNVDSGSIVIDKTNYQQFMQPYSYRVTARN